MMMPSDNGEIVIGVDLDGVCADFYARMREIAAEWFERDISELTPTPSSLTACSSTSFTSRRYCKPCGG